MTAPARHDEAGLRRRGLQLASFIIVWDVIEGIVAVTAGLLAGSIALVGFGIDSAIEVFAAAIVVWQLRSGGDKRRGTALRLIAPTFSPCESRTSASRSIPIICSGVYLFRAIQQLLSSRK